MSDISDPPVVLSATGDAQQKKAAARTARARLWHRWHQFSALLKHDWQTTRCVSLGLALLLVSSLIVIAYYLNHPTPETDRDTPSYLAVTQHIMTSGMLVDPIRLPGYPLLITLTFLVAGQGNLLAVSIAQAILFVVAVVEIYIITCMVTRRAWMGVVVGLVVASNTYLLSFIKPVLSEGFSLWVVVSLALALVLFTRTLRASYLWLVAALLLLAVMTRAEWDYGPVPIFAFLLMVSARHGRFRRLAPHALAAVLLVYGLLGLYIYENATQNGVAGVTVIQRVNLLGKVLQYNMQGEAPPQYAALIQEANAYRATGAIDPFEFADLHPEVLANHWALADAYATAIVEHHPLEFLLKTIPVIFNSSNVYYEASQIAAQGSFGGPLLALKSLSLKSMLLYRLFPFFALLWLGLLLWRRTGRLRLVEMMGAVALVGFYELVVVSLGGYASYMRLHTAFEPLMFVVVCGSLLLALPLSAELLKQSASLRAALALLWPVIRWVWVIMAGCAVLSAGITVVEQGLSALVHPHRWIGFSLVYNNLALSGIILGLLILFTYRAHQARRLQAAPSGVERAGRNLALGRDAVDADDRVDSVSGEASLTRQPEG